MLNVYAALWCPHCRRTIKFLEDNEIEMNYFEIEEQPEDILQKVVQANGGADWVVPTLEFQGQWRPGKVFNAEALEADLQDMGVLHPGD